ncbi:ABC transporter ATP-binding protein [Gracilibacillus alcaliphilus]|uniref:ABC transporter ATP-binding protein n=1 Tax=Gracilibacillus alcaliphilus TaxID=1401441 RepID=UPI0019566BE7|nr:ABC transporter ATP-binding protein [Gracilibacillus alcaliphilus]MBM7678753.1 ATP-binding cassette subfamily B protein [Gracilibacillus alcaliphilus]
MIRKLYRLWPDHGILLRLGALHAILAVLQGLLLGLLVPILRALLQIEPDFQAAAPWLIAGTIGLIAYWILTIIATPVGFSASMDLAAGLRHHLMNYVSTLPLGWFTDTNKARLARAVTADSGNVAHLAVVIGAPAIVSMLVPLTIIGVVWLIDWRVALVFLVIIPIALITLRRAGRIASESDIELEEAAAEIAGRAIELGQAQTVLRAAGQGRSGSARMREALDEHRASYRRGLRRSMIPDLTYTAVVLGGFVGILALTVQQLLSGSLTFTDTLVVLVLAVRFLEPLGNLIELIGALRAMENAVVRIQSILDTPTLPMAVNASNALNQASIEFEDVTFSYGGTPALRNVSFQCRPGSTTALVGPSGSGKTTVIRLIARFFDTDTGNVRVGGIDVRKLDPAVLLNDIAIVFQEVYLFDSTIEENLRLARPDASREQLERAACAARLDEVIERLPEGWNTRVGEGGSRLSGGERQRVSIARAFLKQSRIVLIDEAASALDPENERAVSEAIGRLARDRGRTVIVIAHRPATLAAADQVIALEAGKVAEAGRPMELRQTNGIFARLYSQYERARNWHIARHSDQNT